MKLQWSHAVVRVRDLDTMVAFYRDVLGLTVSDRGPLGPGRPEIVFLSGNSSDHHQIAFVPVRGPEDASSLEHMAFRVDTLAEVKLYLERIKAADHAPKFRPVTHGNAISVYSFDPEGNGVEVFVDTPWHVRQPQGEPWDPSQSDEEILAGVRERFASEPEFMPMEDYRAQQAARFGEKVN